MLALLCVHGLWDAKAPHSAIPASLDPEGEASRAEKVWGLWCVRARMFLDGKSTESADLWKAWGLWLYKLSRTLLLREAPPAISEPIALG